MKDTERVQVVEKLVDNLELLGIESYIISASHNEIGIKNLENLRQTDKFKRRVIGQKGCYSSHLKSLELGKLLDENIIVFEDDNILDSRILETIDEFEKSELDILLYGTPQDGTKLEEDKFNNTVPFWGTWSYMIKKDKIQDIIDLFDELDEPIDNKLSFELNKEECKLKSMLSLNIAKNIGQISVDSKEGLRSNIWTKNQDR